jgi:hypothetical protein
LWLIEAPNTLTAMLFGKSIFGTSIHASYDKLQKIKEIIGKEVYSQEQQLRQIY